jgi:hypothetical protein
MSNVRPHCGATVPTPPNNKDDLWAQFLEKSGASKHAVSARALAIFIAIVLLVLAALALR